MNIKKLNYFTVLCFNFSYKVCYGAHECFGATFVNNYFE